MAMKINELMIGDYICLDGDINYDNPIRIQQIGYQGKNDIVADSDVFGVEDIIPIPLTEDILVKNGFEKRYFDYDFSYDLYEDDNVSFVRLYDHGEGVFFTETSGGDILIKYVHQLQHLIRLCGIEKEIEL